MQTGHEDLTFPSPIPSSHQTSTPNITYTETGQFKNNCVQHAPLLPSLPRRQPDGAVRVTTSIAKKRNLHRTYIISLDLVPNTRVLTRIFSPYVRRHANCPVLRNRVIRKPIPRIVFGRRRQQTCVHIYILLSRYHVRSAGDAIA